MLFTEAPRPRRRLRGFAISAVCHGCLLALLVSLRPVVPLTRPVQERTEHYSIRFVRLQMLPASREEARTPGRGARAAIAAPSRTGARTRAGAPPHASEPAPAALASTRHRPFELPPIAHVNPVKQTLVQLDLPPDIVLRHEIPLPPVLIWTQTELPKLPRRPFVAPAVRQVTSKVKQQNLPAAPSLTAPNTAVSVADLKISETTINNAPRLPRPPANAPPVRMPVAPEIDKMPQIALSDPAQASPANVISLPETDLHASGPIVALPPANQIAKADIASGASGAGAGTGSKPGFGNGPESATNANGNGSGTGAASGDGHSGAAVTASATPGNRSGAANGYSVSASGGGDAPAGSGEGLTGNLPGVTRITLPKEGKFGVVVQGSATAQKYPQSAGALSGKIVYTVYLRVGLRKNWILQYCLPANADASPRIAGTRTPLEAPWPFLIMRPDSLGSDDPDYVMVHGMITAAGHFDQLAMVFPDELERRELLMSSLKLWAFRPASRDGVNTSVEVLLIIPRQTE